MKRKFPRYLSNPYQILMFEADELLIILIFLILWLVFGYIFLILLFIVPYIYFKAKKKYARGFLKHLLYRVGFIKLHNYPIHFQKVFFE